MKNELVKIFQKKQGQVLQKWLTIQAADDSLREDMISNEDIRMQSEELLSSLIENLNDSNLDNL